jgi:hypothetical protein
MTACILLTQDNKYVKTDGTLPARPDFDKALLEAFCKNQIVSNDAYKILPPSIKNVVAGHGIHYDMPICIQEIALADILIIVRSLELVDSSAKEFRLDNFECIVKDRKIEIWSKK